MREPCGPECHRTALSAKFPCEMGGYITTHCCQSNEILGIFWPPLEGRAIAYGCSAGAAPSSPSPRESGERVGVRGNLSTHAAVFV